MGKFNSVGCGIVQFERGAVVKIDLVYAHAIKILSHVAEASLFFEFLDGGGVLHRERCRRCGFYRSRYGVQSNGDEKSRRNGTGRKRRPTAEYGHPPDPAWLGPILGIQQRPPQPILKLPIRLG